MPSSVDLLARENITIKARSREESGKKPVAEGLIPPTGVRSTICRKLAAQNCQFAAAMGSGMFPGDQVPQEHGYR
jgi:hypothetical protein